MKDWCIIQQCKEQLYEEHQAFERLELSQKSKAQQINEYL